jgi:hypothetical protein
MLGLNIYYETRIAMKRMKWSWLMLILVIGSMLIYSCEKAENGQEEELLDASRPNYGDPFKELPTNSALIIGSSWSGYQDGISLRVTFNTTDCVFRGYNYNTAKDTLVEYAYTFKYPTLTLKLKNDTAIAVIGTARENYQNYGLSFKDAHDSTVWIPVRTVSKAL